MRSIHTPCANAGLVSVGCLFAGTP